MERVSIWRREAGAPRLSGQQRTLAIEFSIDQGREDMTVDSIPITWRAGLLSVLVVFVQATPRWPQDTIKLGIITARSGAHKRSTGDVYLEGVQFAMDEINEEGGCSAGRWRSFPSTASAASQLLPYMATMFWAEAVKKAGSLDVDRVIEAWEGLIYEGPAGMWTMRAFDHQTQLPIWTAEIVPDNPYFDHAYLGEAVELPAELVSIPAGHTGGPGFLVQAQ